jgi:hypothetical protein
MEGLTKFLLLRNDKKHEESIKKGKWATRIFNNLADLEIKAIQITK